MGVLRDGEVRLCTHCQEQLPLMAWVHCNACGGDYHFDLQVDVDCHAAHKCRGDEQELEKVLDAAAAKVLGL